MEGTYNSERLGNCKIVKVENGWTIIVVDNKGSYFRVSGVCKLINDSLVSLEID